jgi:uncharacterized protein (DUF433 family)
MRDESVEDAARLLNVSMTRATHELVLSAHGTSPIVERVRKSLADVARRFAQRLDERAANAPDAAVAYHSLAEATMTVTDRIELNPNIMQGKPLIRGTRVTVEFVLRKIAEGADEATLLVAYPSLTKADIQAAVTYAADSLAHAGHG